MVEIAIPKISMNTGREGRSGRVGGWWRKHWQGINEDQARLTPRGIPRDDSGEEEGRVDGVELADAEHVVLQDHIREEHGARRDEELAHDADDLRHDSDRGDPKDVAQDEPERLARRLAEAVPEDRDLGGEGCVVV